MQILIPVPIGATSHLVAFEILDTASLVGAAKAGLVYNSTNLVCYSDIPPAAGAATARTLATMTKGTWASDGFVAVDGTNMPGMYQYGVPDALIPSTIGGKAVIGFRDTATALTMLQTRLVLVGVEAVAQSADNNTILAHGTYGNAAIKTAVDDIDTETDAIRSTDLPAIKTSADAAARPGASMVASNMVATAPTLSEIWGYLLASMGAETTIGGRIKGFVTSLVYATPPAAAPSASDNAAQVRTNLTTELADIVAIAAKVPAYTPVVDANGKVLCDDATAAKDDLANATDGLGALKAAILADIPTPVGYTRVTHETLGTDGEALGTLLPGTVLSAYLSTDATHATRVVPDPPAVDALGHWYIDLPDGGTYTLVGRLARESDSEGEVTT